MTLREAMIASNETMARLKQGDIEHIILSSWDGWHFNMYKNDQPIGEEIIRPSLYLIIKDAPQNIIQAKEWEPSLTRVAPMYDDEE